MTRATALFLLLLLGLLGGGAWLLLGVSGNFEDGFSESPFDLDAAEAVPAPADALDAGELERSAAGEDLSKTNAPGAPGIAGGGLIYEKSTVRGRRVDAQGAPLPAHPLQLTELGPTFGSGQTVSKSELGVFQTQLQQPEDKAAGSWLCLQHLGEKSENSQVPAPDAWVFARAVDPLTRLQDLGDLVAGAGPTALAGEVMDLDRRPISGAKVEVEWSPGASRASARVFTCRSGADGRFQFLGSWPDLGKWSVHGSHPEYLPATQAIAPGATSVALLLPRGTALRGRILVDPDISLKRLSVRIRARRDGSKRWEQNHLLRPDSTTGEFAAAGLVTGWGRIRVFDRDMKWNLHFQYGIPLPAGLDAQVPELQPLDLRGRLKNFKLTALLPDGSLAQELEIVVREKNKKDLISIPNPLECIVPMETIEILVTAKGCLEQAVFITGAEQTIRLEQSPRIAFYLQNPPHLDADGKLQISVDGIEGTDGRWELKFDATGTAELDLPPGIYAVLAQVGLRKGNGTSYSPQLPLLPDGALYHGFVVGPDGSPGRVQVQVDAVALQAALSALRDPKPR